jgi:aspartate kinase
VAGVAADLNQVKFNLQNLPERPGVASKVFGALSAAAVVVDVIVQDIASNGRLTLSFTVGKTDQLKAREVLEGIRTLFDFSEMKILEKADVAKVSIVGVGMQNHPGVASKMFELLGNADINIELITTSEIKVSCLIAASQAQRAVQVLHSGFGLDR